MERFKTVYRKNGVKVLRNIKTNSLIFVVPQGMTGLEFIRWQKINGYLK